MLETYLTLGAIGVGTVAIGVSNYFYSRRIRKLEKEIIETCGEINSILTNPERVINNLKKRQVCRLVTCLDNYLALKAEKENYS